MYVAQVEIYSDASNAAVLRHPGRQFPGLLIQGDTLRELWRRIDALTKAVNGQVSSDISDELVDLEDSLRGLVSHYARVLADHGLELPFPPWDRT